MRWGWVLAALLLAGCGDSTVELRPVFTWECDDDRELNADDTSWWFDEGPRTEGDITSAVMAECKP